MSPQLRIYECSVRWPWRAAFAGLCAFAVAGPGAAQVLAQLEQTHKLTAADADAGDIFGQSVSIDGNLIVIGAQLDGDAGTQFGSAYVYRFDGSNWIEEAKLTASDGAPGDRLGVAVSVSGNVIVVGAAGDDDGEPSSGSAYVFRFDGTQWIEEAKLTASDPTFFGHFGEAISVCGDAALIGRHDRATGGAAYVYRFDPDTSKWIEEAKLTASDGAAWDMFGKAVSLSGDVAVIGAYLDDDACPENPDCNTGSAYVYRFSGTEWVEEAKLTARDADAEDFFGERGIAVHGGVIVVGSAGDDEGGNGSGSAYVFRFDGVAWNEEAKLTASDSAAWDEFGHSAAISENVIVIGARNGDAFAQEEPVVNSGAAYVYRFDGLDWIEETKLSAADPAIGDGLGRSISMSGNLVVIGAYHDDDACPENPSCDSGSAYVFAQSDPCADEDGDGRVTLCHIPPGNPDSAHTITVSAKAVPAHLAHGDHCGPCEEDDGLLLRAGESEVCSADINGDGAVGPFDLAIVLGAWGPCEGCPTDFNGDNVVDAFDLAQVLGAWGICR